MKIKKAVIPVAGKGTRFLPATKQIPKEMLPIIDKPMIHYVVEEALDSGIESIVFITSSGKESIEKYFSRNNQLESFLLENDKQEAYELIKNIGERAEIITVEQKEQLGLGHAIACAGEVIKDEDFAVLLGDDLLINDPPVTKQLIEAYEKLQGTIIGVMNVPREDTSKYGIVYGDKIDEKSLRMKGMIEKPKPDEAPTTLATPGRYILQSSVFEYLQRIPKGAGGEYQLTDALSMMAKEGSVYAYEFQGERFDTGQVPGYLEATIAFALKDKRYSQHMKFLLEKYRD